MKEKCRITNSIKTNKNRGRCRFCRRKQFFLTKKTTPKEKLCLIHPWCFLFFCDVNLSVYIMEVMCWIQIAPNAKQQQQQRKWLNKIEWWSQLTAYTHQSCLSLCLFKSPTIVCNCSVQIYTIFAVWNVCARAIEICDWVVWLCFALLCLVGQNHNANWM